MKRINRVLTLLSLFLALFLGGCLSKKESKKETTQPRGTATQPASYPRKGRGSPPKHVKRRDVSSPVITSIHASSYIHEKSGSKIEFSALERDKISFSKYVFNWKLNPAQNQVAFLADKNHLPYFIVSVEDADTVAEKLSVHYYFSFADQSKAENSRGLPHYRSAEKYMGGKKNQWIVILSEQTAGKALTTFTGSKEITLHVKAIDSTRNKTTTSLAFHINNLKPEVTIQTDPNYMESESYPLKHRSVFWGDKQTDYISLLRNEEVFAESIVFSKVLIENNNLAGMVLSVSFRGFANYEFQNWHKVWKDNKFTHTLLSEKKAADAPISLDVIQLKSDNLIEKSTTKILKGSGQVFILPSSKSSGTQKRVKGLVILLLTKFDFQTKYQDTLLNNAFKPNLFIDTLKIKGFMKIKAAPEGMPKEFYQVESNWRDYSHLFSRPLKIVSSN